MTPDKQAREALIERLLTVAERVLDRGYISQSIEEERPDHEALSEAITALRTPAEEPEAVASVQERYGWKCNCCQTIFTSTQSERHANDNNGGPSCPYCKAFGQYTYRYELHEGDPCIKCGTPHDDVEVGLCTTPPPVDEAKVRVTDEMVKRASDAYDAAKAKWQMYPEAPLNMLPSPFRDALEAALSPAPAVDEKRETEDNK